MITEAEIISIDYTSNNCTVRIPLFEHAGFSGITSIRAFFAIQPGVYNGYKVGDLVFVSFERNKPDLPIILGKIYRGASVEATLSGGTIIASDLIAKNTVKLPLDTTIDSTDVTYNNLNKIINRLNDFDIFEQTHIDARRYSLLLVADGKIIICDTKKYYPSTAEGLKLFIYNLKAASTSSIVPFPARGDGSIYGLYSPDGKKLVATRFSNLSDLELDTSKITVFSCNEITKI